MIGSISPPFLPLLCGVSETILLGYFWSGRAVRAVLNRHLSQFRWSSTVSGPTCPSSLGWAPPPAVWPLPLLCDPPPPKHSASCWCITSTLSALAWRSAGGKTLNRPQVRASFLLLSLVLNMLGAGSLSCRLFRRPPASPASLCAIPHVGGGGGGRRRPPWEGCCLSTPLSPPLPNSVP